MATSGYKDITVTKNHYIRFSWTLKSQSVANNTSTVSWNMKLVADEYGYMVSSTAKNWSVTVNGTKYSGTVNITHNPGDTLTLASDTTTITHSADGTKTFNYSFSQQINVEYAGTWIYTFSGSGSGTLTTIPRASSVTASNNYIESQSTISISRASSSFTHTLQYKIGTQSSYTTIVSKTSSTSYKWTIPTAAYNYVSSTGKTVTITIKCITYNGSTNIGEKTTTLTATCSESKCKPTLAPTVEDTGKVSTILTGDGDNIVIKGYNVMSYAIGATARNGATIKSQKITCGSKSATAASGTLSYVTSNVFTISAIDSRGFTTTQTITKKTLVNYVAVTCNLAASAILENDTNTTTVNFTISGNWFNGSFGAVTNSLTVQYRYKTNSGSYGSWITLAIPQNASNTYTTSQSITGLDYQNTYTIQARAFDEAYNNGASNTGYKVSSAKTVSSKPVFDWGKEDFNFNVPVKMPQNSYKSANGGLNMNNSDLWGINGLYFSDVCSYNSGEGILFPREDGTDTYDVLSAFGGKLYFKPNHPTNTTPVKLCYGKGDTMKIINNTPLSGFISNGKKTIFIGIPLNKPLSPEVTGYTISGKLQGRSIGGYLQNPTTSSSTYNLSDAANEGFSYTGALSGSLLYLHISFSEAITAATNNTPLCIVPDGTITITFT